METSTVYSPGSPGFPGVVKFHPVHTAMLDVQTWKPTTKSRSWFGGTTAQDHLGFRRPAEGAMSELFFRAHPSAEFWALTCHWDFGWKRIADIPRRAGVRSAGAKEFFADLARVYAPDRIVKALHALDVATLHLVEAQVHGAVDVSLLGTYRSVAHTPQMSSYEPPVTPSSFPEEVRVMLQRAMPVLLPDPTRPLCLTSNAVRLHLPDSAHTRAELLRHVAG